MSNQVQYRQWYINTGMLVLQSMYADVAKHNHTFSGSLSAWLKAKANATSTELKNRENHILVSRQKTGKSINVVIISSSFVLLVHREGTGKILCFLGLRDESCFKAITAAFENIFWSHATIVCQPFVVVILIPCSIAQNLEEMDFDLIWKNSISELQKANSDILHGAEIYAMICSSTLWNCRTLIETKWCVAEFWRELPMRHDAPTFSRRSIQSAKRHIGPIMSSSTLQAYEWELRVEPTSEVSWIICKKRKSQLDCLIL